jgi:DNA-binding transcriptional LysR family regulator
MRGKGAMLGTKPSGVDSRTAHKAVRRCTAPRTACGLARTVHAMPDPAGLNWDDLRTFLLAAQAKTLAGAARAAGVQHTTIARRLSSLENALGAPLFLRRPDGLVLTPLGETLVPLALNVERSVVVLHEAVRSRRSRVRVALPSGFIALFADDLAHFGQAHPEVLLDIVSGGQALDLQRGEAELAVRVGPIRDPDLVARPLGDVGLSLYAATRYLESHPAPVNPEELAGHHLIAYGADLAATPAARWIEARSAQAVVVLRTNEIATMLAAAASGAGIALLPCLLADVEPRLVRLTPAVLARRGLSLVYRREVRMNKSVRVAATFLVEAMRSRAHRIDGSGQNKQADR